MAARTRATSRLFAILLFIVLTVQVTDTASAHKPIFDSGGETMATALIVPDPLVSYAIYAQFDPALPQIQFYRFDLEAGQTLNFQVLIPKVNGLESFAPHALLMGPGLPIPGDDILAMFGEFGISPTPTTGAILWSYNGTENVEEFEPFTQTVFWERQSAELTVNTTAEYHLAMLVPDGAEDASGEGKYVLAPGKEEDFGIIDYIAIPVDWVKVRSFWEQSLLLYLLPTFIVVAVGSVAFWYGVRSERILMERPAAVKPMVYTGFLGGLLMVGTGFNQVLLVVGSPHFSDSAINAAVVAIQLISVAVGFLAIRSSITFQSSRGWIALPVPVVLTFVALMIGAGFVVGPMLFLIACAAHVLVGTNGIRTAQ